MHYSPRVTQLEQTTHGMLIKALLLKRRDSNQISLRLVFTGLRLLKTFCPHHTTCGHSQQLAHKGEKTPQLV